MITVEGLSKRYPLGERPAVDKVDIHVRQGEFVAVMGPSGSGKSTLLNLIGGLDVPDHGKISVDGLSLHNLSEKRRTLIRRRKIGYIFQNYQLLSELNVKENIAFPMAMDRCPREEIQMRVQQLIHALDLKGKENSFPAELSGGQQQRVAIARALAMQPRVILADEPTGNLDRRRSYEVLEILSRLHREERLTIIMVTHDLSVAGCAERVLLFKDGRIESDIRQTEVNLQRALEDFLAELQA
ncbi:ABC transporter ATP-binding protein [Desmospora activa]|uniref:Putative ABC transport system ATP-binding protein n=1 Tax=Desmospora activa DSM 45169 TaxID=1121389 RepID=A0A2T4ZAA9_9BACL|nr:ABC transporter ATP-binding protein [Desmospora activa]PTM58819.1 putative ABC transport system ATP-binding protein [Desmospora activa DSM 45169]